MKVPAIIFSILAFLSLNAFAQQTTSKKALKQYKKAQDYKQKRDFNAAIQSLYKAVDADPQFVDAYFDLAYCNQVMNNRTEAVAAYQKVAELAPDDRKFAAAHMHVARAQLSHGHYAEAKASAQKFIDSDPSARYRAEIDRAKRLIETAEFALKGMEHPVPFNPAPLPETVNQLPQQYFPVITADGQQLFFTGQENDEDIYASTLSEDGWAAPKKIEELSTYQNEGTCTISADGKTLIFTACEGDGERFLFGLCDLYISYKTGDTWSKPLNMGEKINGRSWESQPALSADGRTLYFVSDRGGGMGGNDIWMSKRDAKGNWQTPINLGAPINTGRDEISPFLHANGQTLYFASDGHQGYGGLDLFKSEQEEGKWQPPANLGYPINNHHNQVSLVISADGRKGYYADEKRTQAGMRSKLMVFDVPESIRAKKLTDVVKGRVLDALTKKPLQAKIELTELDTEERLSVANSDQENGEYMIVLTEGAEYALHVYKEGYLYNSLTFNYTQKHEPQTIEKDILLQPVKKGAATVLNNIFFETGSAKLMEKSKTELDQLIGFLKNNPKLKIEISGHTDDVGSEADNLSLSEARAKAVMGYLLQHDIPSSRLISIGKGEEQPQVPNTSPENRALNRRIEFKIL